jgi:hypothetical protein
MNRTTGQTLKNIESTSLLTKKSACSRKDCDGQNLRTSQKIEIRKCWNG